MAVILGLVGSLIQGPGAGAAPETYSPLHESQARALLKAYDGWQVRLQKLVADPANDRYFLAKAQQWLLCSKSELTDTDRGPLVAAAFSVATNLIGQLESKKSDPRRETVVFPFVPSIRPDLWELARELKRQPNFQAGEVAVAFLEVQLVWAAYDYKNRGWRVAKPTLEKAEQYADTACQRMQYHRKPFRPQPFTGTAATPGADPTAVLNLDALQERLRELNAHGLPIRSYAFAKAQRWLDFARAENESKDRSGIVMEAARQAHRIVQKLENGELNPGPDLPLSEKIKMVRPDLWKLAESLKRHPAFDTVADEVAKLEVQLIWAGYEYAQLGWRTARPHVAEAERLAKEAEQRLKDLPQPTQSSALDILALN